MNSTSLTITTGSRLHFGPLSYGTTAPPFFGGVGLMVDSPGFRIEFRESDRDAFDGPPEHAARAESFLSRCRRQFDGRGASRPVHVTIHEAIPSHAGFGSGTQLGLAIAKGFTILNTDAAQPTEQLAILAGRGRRSAIGIHGFDRGGFLVDAGKKSENKIGELAAHVPFPEEWRFVLVTPDDSAGFSGNAESSAFAQLPPMPLATTDRLCRIALMQLLPAVRHADFARFADALFEFGKTVGEYFAPAQGGVFRHPGLRELVASLRRDGVMGIAQSSWGPTICIAEESEAAANRFAAELRASSLCGGCGIHIARPRNTGASM